jgi:hypothetical protein
MGLFFFLLPLCKLAMWVSLASDPCQYHSVTRRKKPGVNERPQIFPARGCCDQEIFRYRREGLQSSNRVDTRRVQCRTGRSASVMGCFC